MPMSKDDRIAISLKIVSADADAKGLDAAKAQLQVEVDKAQKIDDANRHLFDPSNSFINAYQSEFNFIDGNQRTTILEQDVIDSANKKFKNIFFPNDPATSVPSLSSLHNVWSRIKPFALTYAIGKNYTEGYGSTTNENNLISVALGYITSAGSNTDIQNTTGQQCTGSPPDTITTFPAVQTLLTNLSGTINSLKTTLISEVAAIVTNDPNSSIQTQNNAAINNINSVIIPALNTWLGYSDFNIAHGQTTCIGFNGYDSSLLAPTKLHSTQLAALQTALNNRSTFLSTRSTQINTVLGSITQDINTGDITSSSGLYGQRYNFLFLRLDALGGSLTKLVGLQASSSAQSSLKSNIISAKAIYMGVLPTSILKAPGNGTSTVSLVDTSFLNPGDTVYVMADNQEELQRAIKSVSGNTVVLNDIVPLKYRPVDHARLYKDLT